MPAGDDRGQAGIASIVAIPVVFLLIVVVAFVGIGAGFDLDASACDAQPPPTGRAAGIPGNYLALYRRAGRRYRIAWNVLAGIGKVETDHGRSRAPGVHDGANAAGAKGPMQFLTSTWRVYGVDGDHDGRADVYDPADAIPAAADYLRAHGAPGDYQAAIVAYNHSPQYVDNVLAWAGRYAGRGAQAITAAGNRSCEHRAQGSPPTSVAGKVIRYARAQFGKPYVWGAEGPDAFDCSGLTMMAYRAAGISIPRTSGAQYRFGTQVPAGRERPGDLVFAVGSDGSRNNPGHVGIVIGGGRMIDAPYTGAVVRIDTYRDRRDLVGFTRPQGHWERITGLCAGWSHSLSRLCVGGEVR